MAITSCFFFISFLVTNCCVTASLEQWVFVSVTLLLWLRHKRKKLPPDSPMTSKPTKYPGKITYYVYSLCLRSLHSLLCVVVTGKAAIGAHRRGAVAAAESAVAAAAAPTDASSCRRRPSEVSAPPPSPPRDVTSDRVALVVQAHTACCSFFCI